MSDHKDAKTTYNDIAEHYAASKQHPWRTFVELHTFWSVVGDEDVRGKTCLDLACGNGFLSRLLKQRGAGRVVGSDISEKMIELAQAEEKRNPLGIEYICEDATKAESSAQYDSVFALYLLNYAQTREQLENFAKAVFKQLKPGGRFVTMNDNVDAPAESYNCELYSPYGFTKHLPDPNAKKNGDPVTYKMVLPDGTKFQFDNYYLPKAVYEAVLTEAGFVDIKWHPLLLAEEGKAKFGEDYWKPMLETNPVLCLEARRPAVPTTATN